ncbi:MAG: TolC family protein [Saprospiraceae bacterium]|nr:TolC family protein [Saprospiraceae bacterium]
MRRINVLLVTGLLAGFCLHAQDTLRLEEAIAIGLKQNFSIAVAQQDVALATNNYTRGNAGMLPSVTLSGSLGKSKSSTLQEFVTGNVVDKAGAASTQYNAAVDLNWTLFDGGKMFSSYEKLAVYKDMGIQQLKLEIEAAVASISTQYYGVAQQEFLLRSYEQLLVSLQQYAQWMQTVFDAGQIRKSDLLLATLEVNRQRANVLRQREVLESVKRQFNQMLGRDPLTPFAIPELSTVPGIMPQQYDRSAILSNNLRLQWLESEKRAIALELDEWRAERYPKLQLSAGYSFNKTENQAGFLLFNRNHGWNAQLGAQWNLFDGSRIRREIANARIRMLQSDIRYTGSKLETGLQIEGAWAAYRLALELHQLETENLKIAHQHYDLTVQNYRDGAALFLEVKEAQRQQEQAIQSMLTHWYDAKRAEIEFQRLNGELVR